MPLSDTRGLHYNEFTKRNYSYCVIHVSTLSLPKDIHNVDRGSSVWGYYFFARFIQATVAPSKKQLIFITTQEFPFLLMLHFWFCLTTQVSVSLEDCCIHEFSPMIHSSSRMKTIDRAKIPYTISITVWKWSFVQHYSSDGMMMAVELWCYISGSEVMV